MPADRQEARSAASTDLAALSERDFWPLFKQAKERVLTNDLDALEALIVEGLPADEMQAAAWALVQRVRGLQSDLVRLERARAAWQREAGVSPTRVECGAASWQPDGYAICRGPSGHDGGHIWEVQ